MELLMMTRAAILETTNASANAGATGPGQRVVVVIDQLEECFTMCRDPEEREAFFSGLERCMEEHRLLQLSLFLIRITLRTSTN